MRESRKFHRKSTKTSACQQSRKVLTRETNIKFSKRILPEQRDHSGEAHGAERLTSMKRMKFWATMCPKRARVIGPGDMTSIDRAHSSQYPGHCRLFN